MATLPRRSFTDEDPAEVMKANGGALDMPLIVSFAGYSFSGKTRSALLFGHGVSKVVGGPVFAIDSERARMREHAGVVPFRRVQLDPPFTAGAYLQAIEYCISKGARAIVIDNMSDEHNGQGGILYQHEEFLEQKAGDDWSARDRWSQAGWAKLKGIKSERATMENTIWDMADPSKAGIAFVMTYRADEKYKPKTRKEKLVDPTKEEDLKWSIESTTKLFGWSTLRYLLMPGCNGVPLELGKAANEAERRLMKVGDRFQNVLPKGKPISVEFGEHVARMCRPSSKSAPASSATKLYEVTSPDGVTKSKELSDAEVANFKRRGFSVVEVPEEVSAAE